MQVRFSLYQPILSRKLSSLAIPQLVVNAALHDDVIKWEHCPRYWLFVQGIHQSPVNSPHKGQWRRPLVFSLICAWVNAWVNNREAGDLRRYRVHYDVTVAERNVDRLPQQAAKPLFPTNQCNSESNRFPGDCIYFASVTAAQL